MATNYKAALNPDSMSHKNLLAVFETRFNYAYNAVSQRAAAWKAADKLVGSKMDAQQLLNFEAALDAGKGVINPDLLTYKLSTAHTIERKLRSIIYEDLKTEPFRITSRIGLTTTSRDIQEILDNHVEESGFNVVLRELVKSAMRYGRAACLCSWVKYASTIATADGSELLDYEGSLMSAISVFDFFPDPSVAIKDVSTKAEYIFTRGIRQRHLLERSEVVVHLDKLNSIEASSYTRLDGTSYINQLIETQTDDSTKSARTKNIANQILIDVGYIWIDPFEFNLVDQADRQQYESSPTKPTQRPRQLFQIWRANETQIIYAQPVTDSPDRIPIVATEPAGPGEPLTSEIIAPFQYLINQQLNIFAQNRAAAVAPRLVVNSNKLKKSDFESDKRILFVKLEQGDKIQDVIAPIDVQVTTTDSLGVISGANQMASEAAGVNETIQGKTPDPRTPATTANIAAQQSVNTIVGIADAMRVELIYPLSRIMVYRILSGEMSDANFLRINNKTKADTLINQKTRQPFVLGDFRFPLAQTNIGKDRSNTAQVLLQLLPNLTQEMTLGILQDTRTELYREILSALGIANISELIRRSDDADSATRIQKAGALAQQANEANPNIKTTTENAPGTATPAGPAAPAPTAPNPANSGVGGASPAALGSQSAPGVPTF